MLISSKLLSTRTTAKRAPRRAQARPLLLAAIVVVCGGGGLLAGRLLARPEPVAVVAPTPVLQNTPAPGAATAPMSVAPQATIAAIPIAAATPTSPQNVAVIPKTNAAPAPQTVIYGHSVKGTPLKATILGDGPNVTLFFGAFHGNEPITDDMVNRLRDYLQSNPQLLNGYRVILAPVVNPDGLSRGKRANARGVDLNRNFPGTWQKAATKARYNPGPSAASEPETKAVIQLIEDWKPTKIVSFHQPFHTMNYTGEPGRQLAQAMKKYNKYPITPDIGYPTPGSFGDYCGRKLKIAIVTYELPPQSADAAWKANQSAMLAAIRQ